MKLWLDDIRPMPNDFDLHVKTAEEAILILTTVKVEYISFDHDLGPVEAGTGYDVACFIEAASYEGDIAPPKYNIHSANPVGRENIANAMHNAHMYWNKK